jgi:hypothetical protein
MMRMRMRMMRRMDEGYVGEVEAGAGHRVQISYPMSCI